MTTIVIGALWFASGFLGAMACVAADAAGLRWSFAEVLRLIFTSARLKWIFAGLWALGPIALLLATIAAVGHAIKRAYAR